jgi:hypothetical protein
MLSYSATALNIDMTTRMTTHTASHSRPAAASPRVFSKSPRGCLLQDEQVAGRCRRHRRVARALRGLLPAPNLDGLNWRVLRCVRDFLPPKYDLRLVYQMMERHAVTHRKLDGERSNNLRTLRRRIACKLSEEGDRLYGVVARCEMMKVRHWKRSAIHLSNLGLLYSQPQQTLVSLMRRCRGSAAEPMTRGDDHARRMSKYISHVHRKTLVASMLKNLRT